MTKEELAVYLWDEGWGLDEIAEDMGLQQKTVKRYLKHAGVEIDLMQINLAGEKAAIFRVEWEKVTESILGGKR